MSGFLLDTCAISESRKPKPNAGFDEWLRCVDAHVVYLSVITLGEIRSGIERLTDRAKRASFEVWLESNVPAQFKGRILSFDAGVADRWGRLIGSTPKGVLLAGVDSFIAATALHHDLSIVTRNVRDFERTGASITNPWT